MVSFYTPISGLKGQSQKFDTIGQNVANAATVGYKQVRTDFKSLVIDHKYHSFIPGGVTTQIDNENDIQGPIEPTQVATNLAIQNKGMFIVSDSVVDGSEQFFYTRAGRFQINKDGNLENTAGKILRGFRTDNDGNPLDKTTEAALNGSFTVENTEPINVSRLKGLSVQPTTAVTACGNLNAASDAITDTFAFYTPVFDPQGHEHSLQFLWRRTTVTPNQAATQDNVWTLQVRKLDENGTPVDGSVVFDAVNQLNPAGAGFSNYENMRFTFNPDGSIASIDTVADNTDLTAAPAGVPFGGTSGTVDTLPPMYIDWDNGANGAAVVPQNNDPLTLSLGAVDNHSGFTQYFQQGTQMGNLASFEQDGRGIGELLGVRVVEEGLLCAEYSNGLCKKSYALPLAHFANVNGLEQENAELFRETIESGSVNLKIAGDSSPGQILGSAVELSTVDIADSFTNLIITQKDFTANAKVITVGSELTDVVTSLVR